MSKKSPLLISSRFGGRPDKAAVVRAFDDVQRGIAVTLSPAVAAEVLSKCLDKRIMVCVCTTFDHACVAISKYSLVSES